MISSAASAWASTGTSTRSAIVRMREGRVGTHGRDPCGARRAVRQRITSRLTVPIRRRLLTFTLALFEATKLHERALWPRRGTPGDGRGVRRRRRLREGTRARGDPGQATVYSASAPARRRHAARQDRRRPDFETTFSIEGAINVTTSSIGSAATTLKGRRASTAAGLPRVAAPAGRNRESSLARLLPTRAAEARARAR
jgi:hypothetical protein